MTKATISYGGIEQQMHSYTQYLLMQAGLENGEYPSADFMTAIDGVDISGLAKVECRRDVATHRSLISGLVVMGSTVTIKDFHPDRERLERFVNTTFAEICPINDIEY